MAAEASGCGGSVIKISILICTHNGEKYLDRVLQSAIQQSLSADQYEILVIDNLSTDRTKTITEQYMSRYPHVRYILEDKLGLCNARNAGIYHARGTYVAFLDDDAFACPDWLRLILKAFETQRPAPAAVGGKIILEWQGEKPDWLPEYALRMLTYIDYSEKGKFLDYSKYEYPFGANMAFRKEDILKIGCFNPNFDRKGKKLLSNGDKSVFLRMYEVGLSVYYEPDAYVHHLAHANRITKDFLNRRQYWQGISDVLLYYAHPSTINERARFRFYAKNLFHHYKLSQDQSLAISKRVFHCYHAWYYWGCLVQEIRMTVKGGGLALATTNTLKRWYHSAFPPKRSLSVEPKRNEMKSVVQNNNQKIGSIIEELEKDQPQFHSDGRGNLTAWCRDVDKLKSIEQHLHPGAKTLETGSGWSTVVFAAHKCRHTCIVPDQNEVDRIKAYCNRKGIDILNVQFIVQDSMQVIHRITGNDLDLVFVDGAHAFPFPIVDWYFSSQLLKIGGIMVIDDIDLISIALIIKFMQSDSRWQELQLNPKYAIFRKLGHHVYVGDWPSQPFSKQKVTDIASFLPQVQIQNVHDINIPDITVPKK